MSLPVPAEAQGTALFARTAGHMTNACAVLQNICNERNIYFEYADLTDDDLSPQNDDDDDDDDHHQRNYPSSASAAEIRYRIPFSLQVAYKQAITVMLFILLFYLILFVWFFYLIILFYFCLQLNQTKFPIIL